MNINYRSRRNNQSNNHWSGKKRYNSRGSKGAKGLDINRLISKSNDIIEDDGYQTEHTFDLFNLSAPLMKTIGMKGFKQPTEIQVRTIPAMMEGRDMIGIAGTGTGKTAAFLIPLIEQLIANRKNNHALIVAPTRELAEQINAEFRDLTKGLGLFSTCLIGGTSVQRSIKDLRRTNHVVIGTPGRLLDMINRRSLKLASFELFILDEFDRMLDMGFMTDIEAIHDQMVSKKQTLFFSATMDKSQKALIDKMTNNPVEIKAGNGTQKGAIDQDIVRIGRDEKRLDVLYSLLNNDKQEKVILFCETKRLVDQVHKHLRNNQILVDVIHGDKSQKAREVALSKFKRGKVNVLVATDVVARGIDVQDVSLVINYEVPRTYDDYVHRIGRTGRAGKKGRALTLVG